jgi:hypothetical protein
MISSYFHLANMSNPPHATSDVMTPLRDRTVGPTRRLFSWRTRCFPGKTIHFSHSYGKAIEEEQPGLAGQFVGR